MIRRALIYGCALAALTGSAANAQGYYTPGGGIGGIVGAVLAPFAAQQRAQAAQQARDAYYHQQQLEQYRRYQQQAQEQAEERQREDEQRQEQAAEAQQERQEQAVEARRERVAEAKQAAQEKATEAKAAAQELAAEVIARAEAAKAAAKEKAAEDSPDNICATHENAAHLLSTMNRFKAFVDRGLEAVDIKHLRTVPSTQGMTCHGTFVLNNGIELTGTMADRTNVAGQSITTWEADD